MAARGARRGFSACLPVLQICQQVVYERSRSAPRCPGYLPEGRVDGDLGCALPQAPDNPQRTPINRFGPKCSTAQAGCCVARPSDSGEWLPWRATLILGCGKNFPQPRRLVRRRGDDALAVGAERRAQQAPAWPVSGSPIGLPVSASHSRAVRSADAVTMRLPSGLKVNGAHAGIPTNHPMTSGSTSSRQAQLELPRVVDARRVFAP